MKIRNRESRGEGTVRIVNWPKQLCVSETDKTNKSEGFYISMMPVKLIAFLSDIRQIT